MASTTDAERERDLREINVAGWKAVDAWVKRGVRIDQLEAEVERLRHQKAECERVAADRLEWLKRMGKAIHAYRAAWDQLERGAPDAMHKSGDVDRMKQARAGLWAALEQVEQPVGASNTP